MDEPEYMRLAPHDRQLVMTEVWRQINYMEESASVCNRALPFGGAEERAKYAAELRRQFATDPEVLASLRCADEQYRLAHRGDRGWEGSRSSRLAGTGLWVVSGGDHNHAFGGLLGQDPDTARRLLDGLLPPRPPDLRLKDGTALDAVRRHPEKKNNLG